MTSTKRKNTFVLEVKAIKMPGRESLDFCFLVRLVSGSSIFSWRDPGDFVRLHTFAGAMTDISGWTEPEKAVNNAKGVFGERVNLYVCGCGLLSGALGSKTLGC